MATRKASATTAKKKASPPGKKAKRKPPQDATTAHLTTRDKLIELFKDNPDREYTFRELTELFAPVSEKTISSLLTNLRDGRAYELIYQPRHGHWKFRDRRSQTNGGPREEDPYRFKHYKSILERMRAHPDLFSAFDCEGVEGLLRDHFVPELLNQLRS